MISRSAIPAQTGLIPLAYLAVYVIWGSTYLAIRVGIETLPPSLLFAWRFLLAGLLNLALARAFRAWRGAPPEVPTQQQLVNAVLIGVLLLVGGTGLVGWAQRTVDSHLAALFISSTPLWVAAWDAALGSRRSAGPRQLAGMALGVVGVAILTGVGSDSGASATGIAFLLLAPCCWAAASSLSHRVALPADVMWTSGIQMLAGAAAFAVIGLALGEIRPDSLAAVSARSWWAMMYLVLFGSTIAFTAFAWLLTVEPAHRVASYALVNPFVAVALGAWLGHETIGPRVWIALPVMTAGVGLHLFAVRSPAPARGTAGGAPPTTVAERGTP